MPGDPQQPARRARQAEVVRIAERALKTPVGVLQVAASDDAILYVELPRRRGSEPRFERWLHGRLLRRGDTPVLRAALTPTPPILRRQAPALRCAGGPRRYGFPAACMAIGRGYSVW